MMMDTTQTVFKLVSEPSLTETLSALLTPVIALFVAYIAYRQWQTSKDKLKLDLFDKRYAVYNSARELLSNVLKQGYPDDDAIYKFLIGTNDARWLFDEDIVKYFEELHNKAIELQTKNIMLPEATTVDERKKAAADMEKFRKWFLNQYRVLGEKLSPYLKLKH